MIRSNPRFSLSTKSASLSTRSQTVMRPASRRCSAMSSASSGRSSMISTRSGSGMWVRRLRLPREGSLRCRWQPCPRVSKSEIETRALVGFSLGPDPASKSPNDPVDDRQADAGTFVVLGPVQPLKNAEKLVGITHVEPDAVVLDEKDRFHRAGVRSGAVYDSCWFPPPRVLQGVADEVDEHLLEQDRLGQALGKLSDRQLHRTTLQVRRQLLEGSLHGVGGRYGVRLEPLVTDLRQSQQVVDQARHQRGPGGPTAEGTLNLRV